MKSAWGSAAVAALAVAITPAVEAADLKVPDCGALLGWAQSHNPSQGIQIAPNIVLDNIFGDDVTTKLFGKPALQWNAGENQAVSAALANCGTGYRKQRNTQAVQALNSARGLMGRSLRGTVNYLAQQERSLEGLRAQLLRGTPTAATYRMLADYDTAEKLTQRYRNLASAPADRVAGIAKDVAEYRAKIRAEALDKAKQAIGAQPDSARSLLDISKQLSQLRAEFDDRPDRKDLEAVETAAKQRGSAIRGKLVASSPSNPPMIFPECDVFLKWAAAANMQQPIQTGSGFLYNAMLDDKLVPVFGRPLDTWTDDEIQLYRDGMQPCVQPVTNQAGQRQQPAGAQQAYQLTNQLPSGRMTLARYKEAQATLATVQKQIKDAEPTMAGIQSLATALRNPKLVGLGHQERQQLNLAAQNRQRQIADKMMTDSTKKLDAFKGGLADMDKIASYRMEVMGGLGRLASPLARDDFEKAFRARDAKVAAAALPEFKKNLAKVPVDPDSPKVVRTAVNELLASRAQGRGLPDYMMPFKETAEARVTEIEKAVHEAKCKKTLSEVKLSSGDAKLEVLGPLGPTTIGDLVCRMVMTGHKFHSYDSPGMFGGKDHKLKVTVELGGYQTITLRKGEIAPGKQALVGFSVADANVEKPMTVPEWQQYASMLTGQMFEAGAKTLERALRAGERQMQQMQRR